ncbi:carbohydrate ABC transporter permease [Nonomuraea jabiensis]|uniref:carbohydrate ABC transporter permease n=1 Tax=Nonomuraea jabiensis TaxID=882448 RepID=UPI0036793597
MASSTRSALGGRDVPALPLPERRARTHIRRFGRLTPWVFLAPFLVFFVAFVLGPAVFGVWVSLHDWDFNLPNKPFVGIENYVNLFTPGSRDFEEFWQSMANTATFVVISVPFLVVLPLGVALLLNRAFPGRTVYRAVFFAPYVLSVSVIGLLWRYLLDTHLGPVNAALGFLGLPDDIPWLQSQPAAWISIVVATVWWTLGFNAIILLAGLQNISPEQYEASALDGANARQQFRYVTLPGLRPVLVFVFLITVLASANLFGQSYVITQGGPSGSTQTAIMYISSTGLASFRMGAAAAMSYLLALFLVVVSLVNIAITARGGRGKRA